MAQQALSQLREGMPVYDVDGMRVGTITRVQREPPGGDLATAIGHIEVQTEEPDRVVIRHVPLTQVLQVMPDRVVVELDRDMVAAHDQVLRP